MFLLIILILQDWDRSVESSLEGNLERQQGILAACYRTNIVAVGERQKPAKSRQLRRVSSPSLKLEGVYRSRGDSDSFATLGGKVLLSDSFAMWCGADFGDQTAHFTDS